MPKKVQLYATHLQKVFSPHEMPTAPLPNQENHPQRRIYFSPRSVAHVLDQLNVRKAPGADRITSRMLRELPRVGILWLTRIYNAILRIGIFPLSWKNAKVIMLHKAGKDSTSLSSYRPISLLSVLSKAFEKLLHRKLLDLLPSTVFPDHQFGFHARHFTTDELQRVSFTILASLQQKEYCAAAFLDVAQAFDLVWHSGLSYKLSQLLPSNVVAILCNYLSNLTFFVVYGAYYSAPRPITAGQCSWSVLLRSIYSRPS